MHRPGDRRTRISTARVTSSSVFRETVGVALHSPKMRHIPAISPPALGQVPYMAILVRTPPCEVISMNQDMIPSSVIISKVKRMILAGLILHI